MKCQAGWWKYNRTPDRAWPYDMAPMFKTLSLLGNTETKANTSNTVKMIPLRTEICSKHYIYKTEKVQIYLDGSKEELFLRGDIYLGC